jgi:flagellar biosynthesis/type III secretory pathway protein FliH
MSDLPVFTVSPPSTARTDLTITREILGFAKETARNIVANARKDAARRIARIYKKSKCRGWKHGKERADAEAVENLLHIQNEYRSIIATAEKDCFALSFAVAEEIIGNLIHDHPDLLRRKISEALANLHNLRAVRIVVHSADISSLQAAFHAESQSGAIELLTSDTAKIGTARIETVAGSIDINWQEQLRHVRERLQYILGTRQLAALHASAVEGL